MRTLPYAAIITGLMLIGVGCGPKPVPQPVPPGPEPCPDVCAAVCGGRPEPVLPPHCAMPMCACDMPVK